MSALTAHESRWPSGPTGRRLTVRAMGARGDLVLETGIRRRSSRRTVSGLACDPFALLKFDQRRHSPHPCADLQKRMDMDDDDAIIVFFPNGGLSRLANVAS
jgi:hypothetical protein